MGRYRGQVAWEEQEDVLQSIQKAELQFKGPLEAQRQPEAAEAGGVVWTGLEVHCSSF